VRRDWKITFKHDKRNLLSVFHIAIAKQPWLDCAVVRNSLYMRWRTFWFAPERQQHGCPISANIAGTTPHTDPASGSTPTNPGQFNLRNCFSFLREMHEMFFGIQSTSSGQGYVRSGSRNTDSFATNTLWPKNSRWHSLKICCTPVMAVR